MNEVLSRAEIESRFPNEWILMVDPDPGWDLNFRGLVVAHGTNREELYEKSRAYRPREIVVFFAGPLFPPGQERLGLGPRGYLPLDPEVREAQLKEVQRLKRIRGVPAEAAMSEIMTRAEAKTLFPDEWVLMDNSEPVTDGNYKGRVLAHGKDKGDVLRGAKGLSLPREVVVFFTGPVVPPGMKVLL